MATYGQDKMLGDFQRDPDVVSYEAFRGLRNDVDPERFSQADLTIAQNIDLDKTGRIARRPGFTSKYSGTPHSLWAKDPLCLFVEGTSLKQLKTDYTASTLRTSACYTGNGSNAVSYIVGSFWPPSNATQSASSYADCCSF